LVYVFVFIIENARSKKQNNSLLSTITLYSWVRTALPYNDTKYSPLWCYNRVRLYFQQRVVKTASGEGLCIANPFLQSATAYI